MGWLPSEGAPSPSLNVFSIQLDKALSSQVCTQNWAYHEQSIGLKTSWNPSYPQLFSSCTAVKCYKGMNMNTLYFFQVHIRGAWKYAHSLSSKAASSIAFSWWGCKDESSLTWWICFRQDSLPDTAIPFIPLSPFNKVITQHTDLGWFRCAFWISRRTLCARKMAVDMMEWQTVCVFVYLCMHRYVHICLQVGECMSVYMNKSRKVTSDLQNIVQEEKEVSWFQWVIMETSIREHRSTWNRIHKSSSSAECCR